MELGRWGTPGRDDRLILSGGDEGPIHLRVEGTETLAVTKDPDRVARYLAWIGEPTELTARAPNRGPPSWKSRLLRRKALGDDDA